MHALDTWDFALLAIAGFIAVTTLVKLMRAHRDDLLKRLRSDFDAEQHRQAIEEKERKKEEAA